MPSKVISTASAEHYKWGGPNNNDSDGWFLVRTPELNIIEERMPSGAAEARHHHQRSRQFFFVLEGELTMEIEHHDFLVRQGEGIEIAPGQSHQAKTAARRPCASWSPASLPVTATASTTRCNSFWATT